MCGNGPWGFIIGGLILAAAMLLTAHPQSSAPATAPATQHTITGPTAHVAIEMAPLTLDIDFAHARMSLEVSL